MKTLPALSLLLSCLVTLALPGAARAHDTWFEPLGPAGVLSLGTGNRFPEQAYPIGAEQLREHGCRDDTGVPVRLAPLRHNDKALLLLAAPRAATCWAQLMPFDVELAPDRIPVYLDEIAAPPAVRERWARLQAAGKPWKERFTKHARVALAGQDSHPVAMGMDALLEGPALPAAGSTVTVRVLRDGGPLAGQPLELVGEQGQSAGWFRTDEAGRIRFTAPPPGRWIVRGVDLRPSDSDADAWDSRFVTLAFRTAAP
jgi:hypothetical protein